MVFNLKKKKKKLHLNKNKVNFFLVVGNDILLRI